MAVPPFNHRYVPSARLAARALLSGVAIALLGACSQPARPEAKADTCPSVPVVAAPANDPGGPNPDFARLGYPTASSRTHYSPGAPARAETNGIEVSIPAN